MYDAFSRAAVDTNVVAREWFTYNMDNFIQRDAAGNIVSATLYFDPTANVKMNHTPAVLLGLVFYALPQATGHARAMYEAAVEDLQWRDESVPIAVSTRNMRNAMLGLIIARDLGDSLVASRLAAALEPLLEPRFFGKGDAVWLLLPSRRAVPTRPAYLTDDACRTDGPPGAVEPDLFQHRQVVTVAGTHGRRGGIP